MPTLTDADPAIPALPEPATAAYVEGRAMQGGEYRNLSADYDEWSARYSVKQMNTRWLDGYAAGRASRVQGEAVAWGIHAKIDGEWALQFPVYGSEHLAKRELTQFVGGIELDVRPLYTAPQAETLAVADFVLVPREFVQGFGTLAHNYSLNAEAPDYYRGVERDAFASAYRRCGEDLAKLRAMLAAAPTPTASIAAEAPASVPDGFWLAPMNLDDEAHEAAEGQDDAFPLAGVRSWYAARDSWLARHPAAPNSTALAAPKAEGPMDGGFHDGYAQGFDDGKAQAERAAPKAEGGVDWMPLDTAPKDGTIVRLLVNFTEHPLEDDDSKPLVTIGGNSLDNTGEDRWQFAGWSWIHDCFTDGDGEVIGWLPMLHTDTLAAPVAQSAPLAKVDAQVAGAETRINVADLQDFDPERYLGSPEAKAAYERELARLAAAAPVAQAAVGATQWDETEEQRAFEDLMLARWKNMDSPPVIKNGEYQHFNWQECWEIWIASSFRRTTPHPEATAVAPVAGGKHV